MKQRISKYSILNESKEDLLLVLSPLVFLLEVKVLGVLKTALVFLESRHSSLVESQGMKLFQKEN